VAGEVGFHNLWTLDPRSHSRLESLAGKEARAGVLLPKVVCPIENPRGREKTPGGPNNYQSTEPTAKSLFNRAKPGNEELTELQA